MVLMGLIPQTNGFTMVSWSRTLAIRNSGRNSYEDYSRRFPSAPLSYDPRTILCANDGTKGNDAGSGKLDRGDDHGDDDNDEDANALEVDLSDQDWRTFRARLVMSEKERSTVPTEESTVIVEEGDLDGIGALFSSQTIGTGITERKNGFSLTPLDPAQWAYESGKVIEQGAVILGGVEQDFGFGLRQQYFHKCAILVLEHDEATFTKGIILNRPTDLLLEDDLNEGVEWKVWYGGDVQGIDSNNPDIVCLHSLKDPQVTEASVTVMKDIQSTSFDTAKRLVKRGLAKPTDFWVFCGYAGWSPGQLMGELDRKSWYMVATDSQTLLKELARLGAGADPRDAGLDTWVLLMNMIGRVETAEEYSGTFADLMLKEWALKNLLSTEAGGGVKDKLRSPRGVADQKLSSAFRKIGKEPSNSTSAKVVPGTLLRASEAERSPFLLENQEYHKAVILIIASDERSSVGVILNRPSTKGVDINMKQKEISKIATLPIRFGGQFAVKGNEVLLWLHYNPVLRVAKIGSPVGSDTDGIWKCTSTDVTTAVRRGLAAPEDFLVISGVSAWITSSLAENWEKVPLSQTQKVWDELARQERLSKVNLRQAVDVANAAWRAGSDPLKPTKPSRMLSLPELRGNDENAGDSLVHKSDTKVSKLSDDALVSWLATFLLGAPSLGS